LGAGVHHLGGACCSITARIGDSNEIATLVIELTDCNDDGRTTKHDIFLPLSGLFVGDHPIAEIVGMAAAGLATT
jgi:hypothetical protein